LTLAGNRIEAQRILEIVLEKKMEQKDDPIHKYALAYYFRDTNSDLAAKYAVEFNRRHGDVQWLWKKDISKDEEEIKSIFIDALRRSNEIRQLYIKQPLPLAFLPKLIKARGISHFWRFNREYQCPIYLESGNPHELSAEIKKIKKCKSILIDYTALLTLQTMGQKYLWLLESIFDEILLYRPLYVRMTNDVIVEENDDLRSIISFISKSKKISIVRLRFCI
jgi:hypothetical protein